MLKRISKNLYSNLKSFENLQRLNEYLLREKFAMTVLYFRANWNPQCMQTDKHLERLASTEPGVEFIRVDSDVASKIARHYSVNYEPEFVFCLFGDEVLRQIGPNYQGLTQKINKMQELAQVTGKDLDAGKWQPYGTSFRMYKESYLNALYGAHTSDL